MIRGTWNLELGTLFPALLAVFPALVRAEPPPVPDDGWDLADTPDAVWEREDYEGRVARDPDGAFRFPTGAPGEVRVWVLHLDPVPLRAPDLALSFLELRARTAEGETGDRTAPLLEARAPGGRSVSVWLRQDAAAGGVLDARVPVDGPPLVASLVLRLPGSPDPGGRFELSSLRLRSSPSAPAGPDLRPAPTPERDDTAWRAVPIPGASAPPTGIPSPVGGDGRTPGKFRLDPGNPVAAGTSLAGHGILRIPAGGRASEIALWARGTGAAVDEGRGRIRTIPPGLEIVYADGIVDRAQGRASGDEPPPGRWRELVYEADPARSLDELRLSDASGSSRWLVAAVAVRSPGTVPAAPPEPAPSPPATRRPGFRRTAEFRAATSVVASDLLQAEWSFEPFFQLRSLSHDGAGDLCRPSADPGAAEGRAPLFDVRIGPAPAVPVRWNVVRTDVRGEDTLGWVLRPVAPEELRLEATFLATALPGGEIRLGLGLRSGQPDEPGVPKDDRGIDLEVSFPCLGPLRLGRDASDDRLLLPTADARPARISGVVEAEYGSNLPVQAAVLADASAGISMRIEDDGLRAKRFRAEGGPSGTTIRVLYGRAGSARRKGPLRLLAKSYLSFPPVILRGQDGDPWAVLATIRAWLAREPALARNRAGEAAGIWAGFFPPDGSAPVPFLDPLRGLFRIQAGAERFARSGATLDFADLGSAAASRPTPGADLEEGARWAAGSGLRLAESAPFPAPPSAACRWSADRLKSERVATESRPNRLLIPGLRLPDTPTPDSTTVCTDRRHAHPKDAGGVRLESYRLDGLLDSVARGIAGGFLTARGPLPEVLATRYDLILMDPAKETGAPESPGVPILRYVAPGLPILVRLPEASPPAAGRAFRNALRHGLGICFATEPAEVLSAGDLDLYRRIRPGLLAAGDALRGTSATPLLPTPAPGVTASEFASAGKRLYILHSAARRTVRGDLLWIPPELNGWRAWDLLEDRPAETADGKVRGAIDPDGLGWILFLEPAVDATLDRRRWEIRVRPSAGTASFEIRVGNDPKIRTLTNGEVLRLPQEEVPAKTVLKAFLGKHLRDVLVLRP